MRLVFDHTCALTDANSAMSSVYIRWQNSDISLSGQVPAEHLSMAFTQMACCVALLQRYENTEDGSFPVPRTPSGFPFFPLLRIFTRRTAVCG